MRPFFLPEHQNGSRPRGRSAMNSFTIARPQYGSLPVAAALDYDWTGYDLTEKLDGRWHELRIGGSVVVGELMPDGRFFAFDLPIHAGTDLRRAPRHERMARLDTFPLLRPAAPQPGESPAHFLQRILAAGGEGIVAALADGPFGYDVCKVKRAETFDCRVVEKFSQSIALELDGQSAGRCAVLGPEFAQIQPGDVVEIAAFSRTARGKFREPRFLRRRPDKA